MKDVEKWCKMVVSWNSDSVRKVLSQIFFQCLNINIIGDAKGAGTQTQTLQIK